MQERLRRLNDQPPRANADYVLYWSQINRRVSCNHALAYAIDLANERDLPLLVYEGVTCAYPQANDRLHTFLLENVPDMATGLEEIGAGYVFYLRKKMSSPGDVALRLTKRAALVVVDDYPTFLPAKTNASFPAQLDVACHAVDSSCIVPMNLLVKREWAAYTIRPKIHRLLPDHLRPFHMPKLKHRWSVPLPYRTLEVTAESIPQLLKASEIDHSVPVSSAYRGGYSAAKARLEHFLRNNLHRYAEGRNEPSAHVTSGLSPYLHFGQISSLEVALTVQSYAKKHKLGCDEFLEELIVRRELGFNFARYANYDSLDSLPDWAKKTLAKHASDVREVHYTREQLEKGETYDKLWNATQQELLIRGKIQGYYRMYWGKKLIEWCTTYDEAFRLMIDLHERYALDGRDPNTYTSVLWCFGLHDRPWSERPIFGQVRYMSFEGMKRKTDINAYLAEIEALQSGGRDPLAL